MSEGDPTNSWPSPPWCNYPGASRPVAGCWSLLGGKIKTASDCGDCECRQGATPPADA